MKEIIKHAIVKSYYEHKYISFKYLSFEICDSIFEYSVFFHVGTVNGLVVRLG